MGWPLDADGIRRLIWLWDTYPGMPPVYVTENGRAGPDPVRGRCSTTSSGPPATSSSSAGSTWYRELIASRGSGPPGHGGRIRGTARRAPDE